MSICASMFLSFMDSYTRETEWREESALRERERDRQTDRQQRQRHAQARQQPRRSFLQRRVSAVERELQSFEDTAMTMWSCVESSTLRPNRQQMTKCAVKRAARPRNSPKMQLKVRKL